MPAAARGFGGEGEERAKNARYRKLIQAAFSVLWTVRYVWECLMGVVIEMCVRNRREGGMDGEGGVGKGDVRVGDGRCMLHSIKLCAERINKTIKTHHTHKYIHTHAHPNALHCTPNPGYPVYSSLLQLPNLLICLSLGSSQPTTSTHGTLANK